MIKYAEANNTGKPASIELLDGSMLISCMGKKVKWELSYIHKKIEKQGNSYIFNYGEMPFQKLETDELPIVKQFLKKYKSSGFYLEGKRKSIGIKSLLLIMVIVIALPILGYIYIMPLIADGLAWSIPTEKEQSLGEEMYKHMGNGNEDAAKTALLNQFFANLHFETEYKPKLHIVKDPLVNAFATPGSHIVVTTGILEQMQNSTELAALIAHELSHINRRHITRSLCRSLGSYIVLSMVIGDASGLSGILMQGADQLRSLSFSRGFEEEADREGFKQLTKQQIDPNGMVTLFEKLAKEQKIDVAEFISTHPDVKRRMEYTKQQITETHPAYINHQVLDSLFNQLKK